MRPLTRLAWDPELARLPASLALEDAYGGYCSVCERDLPEGGVAWDRGRERVVGGEARPADWPDLLLLCRVCAAHVARSAPGAAAPMALPHRDRTFALDDPPFRYEPRRLAVRHAGADTAGETVERVVAVGRTPQAAETVRRFALNTVLHNGDELVLPPGTSLAQAEQFDWRLIDRTAAWRAAERAAERLAASSTPRERELLSGSVATLAELHGCWSVWATVLWSRFGDSQLMTSLLRAFPGTRDGWLANG